MTAPSAGQSVPLKIPERFNLAEHFLFAPAARHPERVAIVGEPHRATYRELAILARRVGNALLEQGISRGDRVLLVLPDSIEFVASFFGATMIGSLAVPVNPFGRTSDYIHYLENCEPSLAIVHSEALEAFLPASTERPQMPIVEVGEGRFETHEVSCARWEDWVVSENPSLTPAELSSQDPAFLLYTSGSGGQPKAAVHLHGDMLVASHCYAHGILGLRETDVTFSTSKLFFAYGLGNGMYFPFSAGAATILNPQRPSPERVIETVQHRKPTVFFSVPTLYAAILREAERMGGLVNFSSVRLCVSAGETLPAEIFERWRRKFGLEILDGIGSTEMLHIFISSRTGQCKPGSCGFSVPGYESKIVDDSGASVADGEIGNLWVRGASAFSEYWRIPELTARTKHGDWVVTGDKFLREPDGHYQYCGRADDMLKVAGMWVSPIEVENAILGHPHVAEAAVVGATDARGLTYAVAYVTLRAGFSASDHLAAEIRNHVRARLVSHKVPREIRFCGELPRTVTGKIQRFKLRASTNSD
ncbi:MAG TPA: benzoate-CoA ligase family protein [Methylomirabilota bacterium]|nr:benzoate-CoA ligase family protein [Methylomirabilota bacterium]